MPIITLTSAAGAPGTSTTALGLALSWPGDSLLVEADPSGSSLIPGWYRASINPTDRNVINIAMSTGRENLASTVLSQCISLSADASTGERRLALLGLTDPAQAAAITSWWPPLATAFTELSAAGYTIIVDAGRCTQGSFPTALLEVADLVLMTCRDDLSSVVRTFPLGQQLQQALQDRFGLAIISSIGPLHYATSEIVAQFGAHFAIAIEADAQAAATLSDGVPSRRSGRRSTRDHSRQADHPDLAGLHPAIAKPPQPGELPGGLMRSYRSASRQLAQRCRRDMRTDPSREEAFSDV